MRRRPSILIVDDEVNVTRTLQLVFEKAGYRVVTAHSCKEALGLMTQGTSTDAILTDLNMEKEDIGLDVARMAQKQRPKPVIAVLTGYASLKNLRAALDLHIDYCAMKPVDLNELLPSMNKLVVRKISDEERGVKVG